MRIGIIGTRGIPNYHGGFEQFAQFFSTYLSSEGHQVFVYNSHDHPYKDSQFEGVQIIRCFDPEYKIGTAGQFIYDLNCIVDSRKRDFDIILQLGYTSSSIWYFLMPKKSIIITNMDGLEWKRSKYNRLVQRFLKFAEKLAASKSDYLVADSIGIKNYLLNKYDLSSKYIAYGATIVESFQQKVLKQYFMKPFEYCLIIARLEPENNIETIINGYLNSEIKYPLLIFGKINTYGEQLKTKYQSFERIKFLGANYNLDELNSIRRYSRFYFHGHSVGGTNPSLLEAMSSRCFIIANDNEFNRSVLGENAYYFGDQLELTKILTNDQLYENRGAFEEGNLDLIRHKYSWGQINKQYEELFNAVLK